jgi:hypothetical protein
MGLDSSLLSNAITRKPVAQHDEKKKDEFKYYIIILLFGLGGGHVLEKSQNGCREYNLIIKTQHTMILRKVPLNLFTPFSWGRSSTRTEPSITTVSCQVP